MNSSSPTVKDEVRSIASDLFSRDPVRFNSAINRAFAGSAVYKGHGVQIKGASNVKHAATLLNALDVGRGTEVDENNVRWDESSTTAYIQTTRYMRPRLFPLFEFGFPVTSVLRFNPQATDENSNKSTVSKKGGANLFVTAFEDVWPLDSLVQRTPLLGAIYRTLFMPIATLFVVFLSNLYFTLFSTLSSTQRNVIEPTANTYVKRAQPYIERAESYVPTPVKHGFTNGVHLAEGLGNTAIKVASHAAYGPLRVVEWGAQTSTSLANRVLPRSLHLPYPSIFGTHGAIKGSTNGVPLSEPLPPRAQDSLHLTDTHSARSAEDDAKNPHHKHQKHHHQSHQSHEEKAEKGLQLPGAQSGELKKDEGAKVVVTPGEDGDQKKSFDLAAHQYTQASQNPHPAQPVQTGTGNANNRSGSSGKGETLFDKIEVPDATQGAGAHASAGASQHAGKKGAKKGAAHEKAPTFEQSLQQA